jgi:DNA-binding IclR family transcriptional regulator
VSSALSIAGISAAAHRIEALVALVAQDPGLTSREVAERLDLSRRQASLLLLRLEERGALAHDGRGWFPAPPATLSAP